MQSTFVDHTYLSSVRRFSAAVPSARKHPLVVWRQWLATRTSSVVVLLQSPAVQTGLLSGAPDPAHWIQRGLTRAGPSECVSLRVYRLFEFLVFLSEGLHPLY